MKNILSPAVCIFFLLPFSAAAATIHVPADQPTIQNAIDAAADGDTVLVAAGTYQENIDFLGKAISVIGEQGAGATRIEAQTGSVVRFRDSGVLDAVIRGFTISGGTGTWYGEKFPSLFGGGIFCSDRSSPVIEDCVITGGSAELGGGIAIVECEAPVIRGCTVSGAGAYFGGGVYVLRADPVITGSRFSGNSAGNDGGGIFLYQSGGSMYGCRVEENFAEHGAGICCYNFSSPEITDCTIVGNGSMATAGTETFNGGGIHATISSHPAISGCVIESNSATRGGGIACDPDCVPLIVNNLISGNMAREGGGINWHGNSSGQITNNTITANSAAWYGGGIQSRASILVVDNIIAGNLAGLGGGGISAERAGSIELRDNLIIDNRAEGFDGRGIPSGGGGISFVETALNLNGGSLERNSSYRGGAISVELGGAVMIRNCTIADNTTDQTGGGLRTERSGAVTISNVTFANNFADDGGGALHTAATVSITDSIFWGNTTDSLGKEVYLGAGGDLTIDWSDLDGMADSIHIEPGSTAHLGEGMIDVDPLFVEGPAGAYYLSQTAAGQPEDSPCVDAGDPAGTPPEGTTRTDQAPDEVPTDLGAHQFFRPGAYLVAGPGPAPLNPPRVRIIGPETEIPGADHFIAYGADQYGVNICTGDVLGEGKDKILTGAGPGAVYGPHVRGFDTDGTPLTGLSFLAYGTNKYGVNVAAGDLDGDARDEIITGAGPGAVFGPHVRAWVYDGAGVTAYTGVSYFAYGTPKWGVNVAAGDIDGDGFDEIVTGPGPGAVYGPHVRGWNVDGCQSATPIPAVSFFAYGTLKYGVKVSCGDVDGDGIDEIVTGAGPGAVFGPHVRGWNFDGDSIAPLPGFSFFAWDTAPLAYGVNVFAGADLDNDGRAELVAGRGPDPDADTEVKVFTWDGSAVDQWLSLEAFPGLTHGTTVAAGRF